MAVTIPQLLEHFSGVNRSRAKEDFTGMEKRVKTWAKNGRLNEATERKQYHVAAYNCTYAKKGSEDLCRQDATKWVDQLLKQVKK